ncbi:uroporphyrinogen III methyltransferase / synthase [Quadrisphaera granulorum]|uniref:uroporphyrinogen-III C-methyltransferase n=1 Tax=Quadrisphaera granulorum TaxID=317664 RepID=A0A316A5W6_9ACTN|nr:uroporphyrinogen-III synthase [Quadrisphaera granulorum]PWJ53261.1 uroporphyrinogen III methyltransferase/synthase [Quadrisphaera granulorum]SZE96935.1 uroporphyrinogen III methyltransferase / synthase [Quadrisphaera granulorum]
MTPPTSAPTLPDAAPDAAVRAGATSTTSSAPASTTGSTHVSSVSTPVPAIAFVGAGPGDPGLLTLRAAELLAAADVVVLDRGAEAESTGAPESAALAAVHRHCRDGVEVLATAAPEGSAPLTGAARAKLSLSAARAGRAVVRLFSGDAASSPQLADELAAVRRAGVAVEVVPGVSVATAVPLYAGIATSTSRASDVHVLDATQGEAAVDAVSGVPGTVIVTGSAEDVVGAAKALLASGRTGSQEVVVTAGGTTTAQRSVSATLATLPDVLAAEGDHLPEPLVAVLGPGVAKRDKLAWFESRPLFGWRVLVPRTQAQSSTTVERLAAVGAVSEVVPTIAVEPPRSPHQMEKAVRGLVTGRYEWVGFTSVNAVRAVKDKFAEYGLDARAFSGLKVAAVGGVTAAELRAWGIEPDLVPEGEQSAAGLLAEWPPYDEVLDPIDRVFLPRADIATDTLVEGLQQIGWQVDDVTAYRTVRAAPPPAPVRDAIKTGAFDAVVFTSSSTVRNLVGIAGKPHPSTVVACIGPATCATATELGLRVDVQAEHASTASLVDALAAYGAQLRAQAEEAGEPVLRPSERRAGARRRR